MDTEFRSVRELMGDGASLTPGGELRGNVGANEVLLSRCGIGKVNAAVGAYRIIRDFGPDCVVSTGCAGGAAGHVEVMDAVVSKEVVYHDVWCGDGNEYGQVQGLPARFSGDPVLYAHALSLNTATKIHGGLICSGDRFITDPEEAAEILRKFPEGLAVDMESAAIAQVCCLERVPFLSFRVISDTPGAENRYQQYNDFWAQVGAHSVDVIKEFLTTLPSSL